ncbi:MAG: bifunctional (p)ppGpp synthetase/guanosine-3',5'-bis(diphosphate) 3'-pyrophosphohydrolase [Methylococcales bacterium]|jgi:(p)ppGpp synthase/HD superfamily hydrolase|nr:bifunctional (p)ppGpp synthetase/guanosine-3',5'-bis(diphosphate) 3'-pyrophosphohydrolase [Methylococcales bacterium]MBT7445716.1 bifunctional (p)ppGpp synthetase/guanosine-3',5'-bis(diphosphate) 3'-pyrophosphohydrolase [Methylococcales bacterium]
MQSLMVLKAADFAAHMHREQRRKGSEASPYINHPITVALLIAEVGGIDKPEVLAAALLHDTVEDTDATLDDIETHFGAEVRLLVDQVSDNKMLTKAERKQQQIEHAASISDDAVLIKLADKIANISDIVKSPPAGWDMARRLEYLDWSESVVNNCKDINVPLKNKFYEVLSASRAALAG